MKVSEAIDRLEFILTHAGDIELYRYDRDESEPAFNIYVDPDHHERAVVA